MVQLTVGQVSGLIAVGIFVVQLAIGLIIPMILVGLLTEENTLNTWSALARLLHTSRWPTLLRSSSATTHRVHWRVVASDWAQMAILAVVTIASIVTPLGLYDVIAASDDGGSQVFTYVPDSSAFGYGTPPRSSAPFVRVCGTNVSCPGQTLSKTCNDAGTLCVNVTYDPLVPNDLRKLFNDGAQDISPTVSGLFDMQWRSYSNWSDGFSSIQWYQRQEFRELANLVLDNKLEAVEGLVVDMVSGGIGFRNHTVPKTSQYGTTWSEDLLFVEPESVCVNLNVSLDFRIVNSNANAQAGYQDIYITDRGGLSGLSRLPPEFPSIPNGQSDPLLRQRALAAGWYNNFLTLAYYNATGPDPTNITRNDFKSGQKIQPPFPKSCNFSDPDTQCPGGSFAFQWNSVQSSPTFGGYLNLYSLKKKPLSVPNPYHVDVNNFTDINQLCGGSMAQSVPSINNTIIGCSLLYGAPHRTDAGQSLIPDPLSSWSMPMYSCATALKATVRTVSFTYNGTGIAALNVTSASPKTYAQPESTPVWGVETTSSISTSHYYIDPLWGILGNASTYAASAAAFAKLDNFSTVTQSSLYLPGYMDNEAYGMTQGFTSVTSTTQNMPGLNFYAKALQIALSITSPGNSRNASNYQGGADYSGFTSMALFAKWQNLSSSADTAGKILDLVWTDYSANAVVGTRGWGLSTAQVSIKGATAPSEMVKATPTSVPVQIYRRVVRYHMPFATPAFVTMAALLATLLFLLVLVARRRANATRMRALLEATSVGRVAAMSLWPHKMQGAAKGKKGQGIERVGGRKARITSQGGILALDETDEQSQDNEAVERTSAGDVETGLTNPSSDTQDVSKSGVRSVSARDVKEKGN